MSLFIGRLPRDTRTRDLEDLFYPFGRLRRCEVKHAQGFGFIEFESYRDAEDAFRRMDGARLLGARISVEWARSRPRRGRSRSRSPYYRRSSRRSRSRSRGRRSVRRSRNRSKSSDFSLNRRTKRDRASSKSTVASSRSPSQTRGRSRKEKTIVDKPIEIPIVNKAENEEKQIVVQEQQQPELETQMKAAELEVIASDEKAADANQPNMPDSSEKHSIPPMSADENPEHSLANADSALDGTKTMEKQVSASVAASPTDENQPPAQDSVEV